MIQDSMDFNMYLSSGDEYHSRSDDVRVSVGISLSGHQISVSIDAIASSSLRVWEQHRVIFKGTRAYTAAVSHQESSQESLAIEISRNPDASY